MGISAFLYSLEILIAASRAQYCRFFPQIKAVVNNFDPEVYQQFAISPLTEKVIDFLCEDYKLHDCSRLIYNIVHECSRVLGPRDPTTLRRNQTLGTLYIQLGSNHVRQAITLLEETAQAQQQVLEADNPDLFATQ
jgi:hypothetical protein